MSRPVLIPLNGRVPALEELSTLLTTVRRHLHMHPEVGWQEVQTAAFIREVLEMHGLAVHGPVAKTGLWTEIEGAHDGPTIGYRADIDALPIQDAKTAAYRSTHAGVGHLCGHDAHTAVAIGVALLLHRMRDRLRGRVRVFFQPNEEGMDSGAPVMIRDGVLDGLAAVYAVHADPTLPTGVFGLKSGAMTAAADRVRVVVAGPGTGHSARPHQAVDTIWVATQILNALYQQVGRVTDTRNPAVLTICRIHGGEAYNVIPQEVEFGGTLRCTDPDDRAKLGDLIKSTAHHVGGLYGAIISAEVQRGAPPVLNDEHLTEHAWTAIRDLRGTDALFRIPRPSMGAEDFAYYLEHVPGVLVRMGTASGPETEHALHHGCFDIDERALALTAHVMAEVLRAHPAVT